MDNIKEWTSLAMPELLTMASCRKHWKKLSAESSIMSPRRRIRSRDWTKLNPSLKTVSLIFNFFLIDNVLFTTLLIHGCNAVLNSHERVRRMLASHSLALNL